MGVELATKGKQQVSVHYVNTPLPCVVEENVRGYFHDHDDFMLAEVLQDQECVYQSFQRDPQNNLVRASSSTSRPDHNAVQRREEGNSSETLNVESQLAIDEALARELQELENQIAATSVSEIAGEEADTTQIQSTTENREHSSVNTSTQIARPDDIDPDNMTYEELQSLGEAIGTENRGLSDEVIEFLPCSTYKTRLFSKKDKHEECVICYMNYKNRDKLMTLPCQHQYHKSCVTRWLKINKACPVCNVEVFGA